MVRREEDAFSAEGAPSPIRDISSPSKKTKSVDFGGGVRSGNTTDAPSKSQVKENHEAPKVIDYGNDQFNDAVKTAQYGREKMFQRRNKTPDEDKSQKSKKRGASKKGKAVTSTGMDSINTSALDETNP